MKLLVNICAHDGIESTYAGVGTIVKRYITAIKLILDKHNFIYKINLFTPKYNEDSFGYDNAVRDGHLSLKNVEVYDISNGSNGTVNFGTIENWKELCKNTAEVINQIENKDYDYIITMANDTPFAGLLPLLNNESNHLKVWIPHSTIKIHQVDSAVDNKEESYIERLLWEQNIVDYINNNEKSYLGSTGRYIERHLIDEYGLLASKSLYIPNGEILEKTRIYDESRDCKKNFEKLKNKEGLVVAFGRAEEYKNLESVAYVANELNLTGVLITKPYFKEQPIIKKYEKLTTSSDTLLFVDVPFEFPHYIINHFEKPLIVLIPSKKEIVGLIINEVRKMNKDNVLIVANDIGGLSEQIIDGIDGVLVNLEDIHESCKKIKKYFNRYDIKRLNNNSQKVLKEKYNFTNTMERFIIGLTGGFND